MKTTATKHEIRLIIVAIIGALLLIFGHLILAKSFSHFPWAEITAALIPFLMFALCVGSIHYAVNADDSDHGNNSNSNSNSNSNDDE
ncbi:hypothetical protein F0249_03075 [Vibrio sp. 03-59-1]|uniref:hypothetical protein n=1 Tax=Vibrio TaxID=662 RepID=UPI001493BFAC|nr:MULTISPECIES: hypothetical protein [Vibrio]MDN3695929.1 hypothetical protein [Vibrio cortegadensis]NOH82779.1 hypothetical protein [Vibrio sp. 03-59-1]